MPLEAYERGSTWWAKGRVEYNGRPITGYIRESTGASEEDGAQDWIAEREERERRRHLLGEEHLPLTFNDAVLLYACDADTSDKLLPIVGEIGTMLVRDITPKMIRELGAKLYPKNATDSWRRWVITPTRAVINNAHDMLGGARCPAITIKGYTEAERVAQDKKRKKGSRIEHRPGDWEWLLKFREHAPRRLAALALFMFSTGRRIGQSVAMHPDDLDLQNARVRPPGAKGHGDEWITIPMELVVELANLPPKTPRTWDRNDRRNLRVFGYADRCAPLKAWRSTCIRAGIDYRPPHAAGRHGFGHEMRVRQDIDKKAVGAFGAWSDTELLDRTYTHAEDVVTKIHAGFRAGLVQAETATGLKLLKKKG
jgi:integrase